MGGGWCYGSCALQRHNTENSKQLVLEKQLRGLNPNFHIHVSVSDLLILLAGKYVGRSWEYLNRSQTHECGNLEI